MMTTTREQMLQRIREAVCEGNRAGARPPQIPERGQIGYQGAGGNSLERFREAFTAAGGRLHVVADHASAARVIMDVVQSRSLQRVFLGHGGVLDAIGIVESLQAAGMEIIRVLPEDGQRSVWFTAEPGVSGVDYLIAETGSVVLASRDDQPRSLSLLPPIHIAVAERRQLLADLFDLFSVLGDRIENLPASLSIITGPSKTGDIELRLVTGVHGPGEVHVVLIEGEEKTNSHR